MWGAAVVTPPSLSVNPMSSHPLNLALRFALELAALAGMGFWGWQQGSGAMSYVLASGVPVLAASVWGTFAVRGDPSRSGAAPVPVSGWVRLVIEVLFFACGVWAYYAAGKAAVSAVLAATLLVHHAISYDRIAWLLKKTR